MLNIFGKKNASENLLNAPADAEMLDISTVNDPVFAGKMMGDGVAFQINEDKCVICSPADGTLSVLFPTGHAFGVTLKNGVEVLIHIGIDTVKENGNGFKLFAKTQGSNVKAGEPIVEVDFGQLRRKYDMTVMLVVTNAANNPIVFLKPGSVKKGQAIIES